MSREMDKFKELDEFVDGWKNDPLEMRQAFVQYRNFLARQPNVSLDFKARPGISYSLRAKNSAQKKRDLFVLVDVVDDDPDCRWLSVCFYADMVTDPDEYGDFVPEGLMGEDAVCFNLAEENWEIQEYIAARLKEAAANAAK